MKKLINILGIVFILTPIFASAETINFGVPPSVTGFSDAFGHTVTQKYAAQFQPSTDVQSLVPVFDSASQGSPTDNLVVSIYTDSGGLPGVSLGSSQIAGSSLTGTCSSTSFPSINVSLSSGTNYWVVFSRSGALDNTDAYLNCIGTTVTGTNATDVSGTWGTYPYQIVGEVDTTSPPPTGLQVFSSVVNNATSSVERTTGVGFNSMAFWMWENLGKPITGSGLGVLYTIRWYIMVLIALAIIIYFGFRYFGFFKY